MGTTQVVDIFECSRAGADLGLQFCSTANGHQSTGKELPFLLALDAVVPSLPEMRHEARRLPHHLAVCNVEYDGCCFLMAVGTARDDSPK